LRTDELNPQRFTLAVADFHIERVDRHAARLLDADAETVAHGKFSHGQGSGGINEESAAAGLRDPAKLGTIGMIYGKSIFGEL